MSQPFPTIAYIIKGYPRNSEAFITNEIALLKSKGLSIHIFSVKRPPVTQDSSAPQAISTEVTYLPEVPSLTTMPFFSWLRQTLPSFTQSHFSLFDQRPIAYAMTLCETLFMCLNYRSKFFLKPKFIFFKEFLQAGFIADQAMKSGQYDQFHAHFCHGATTIALLTSRMTGLPYSFTAHAKDIYLPTLNPKDLLQKKMRHATFIATCTEANRSHLQEVCPNAAKKVHRVYHGVNTKNFVPHHMGNRKVPLILSVGRHVKKKGFTYLIQAFGILRDRGHQFQCMILGESDEETSQIRQFIRSLDLETIITLEPGVSQEELRHIYHRATIFALACHIVDNGDRDGIPNVLAEAMAAGIPVVSTAVSGIPELIRHRKEGLLVAQKNREALADALEELLVDPALRTTLAQAGRKRVLEIFDAQSTIEDLAHLFQGTYFETFDPKPMISEAAFPSAQGSLTHARPRHTATCCEEQPHSSHDLSTHHKTTIQS